MMPLVRNLVVPAPIAVTADDRSAAGQREVVDAVTAAIARENRRLRAELHARLDELRVARRHLLDAGQRERQRLERDLHDGVQQRLVALSLGLGVLERRLESDPQARAALADAKREIARSLDELRGVAHGLYPAVLSGHGLAVALESLAARAPVPARLAVHVDDRPAEPVEVAAYYVACESLTNIGKHAGATQCTIDLDRIDDTLVVEVVDDGIGGADMRNGTGLRGLADRVEALGGRLQVRSSPGCGTRVRAEIPYPCAVRAPHGHPATLAGTPRRHGPARRSGPARSHLCRLPCPPPPPCPRPAPEPKE
jgi:signal transduction histidine kinase